MTTKEKDIETAFVNYLKSKPGYHHITRQVRLPMGVLDIFCIVENVSGQHAPMVVEVKRGPINAKACAQLLGYMQQARNIYRQFDDELSKYDVTGAFYDVPVYGALVGGPPDTFAKRILRSSHLISYYSYRTSMNEILFHSEDGYLANDRDLLACPSSIQNAIKQARRETAENAAKQSGASNKLEISLLDEPSIEVWKK